MKTSVKPTAKSTTKPTAQPFPRLTVEQLTVGGIKILCGTEAHAMSARRVEAVLRRTYLTGALFAAVFKAAWERGHECGAAYAFNDGFDEGYDVGITRTVNSLAGKVGHC